MKNDSLEARLEAIERAISFVSVALLENTPADVYREDINNLKYKLNSSSVDVQKKSISAQMIRLLDPISADLSDPF
ncbi:hypothetical protein Xmau_00302 [Xenorhabdus mauleonii]|uniref:Uncharacterized protein n=1 Tax=Xenorhabdus mauleonii TaxID=351675 RepID=A0A1I3U5K4_9GAMM|nr:hypothetical protein [Xenorhabdus mauleonii]PHM45911.1 hypothetical protein Xmau_00302 [Xenorhabdus mauleonii]SFJ78192.1 hypothetical protein SAMN05421680_11617 [Xenorhabdus mauleonii]